MIEYCGLYTCENGNLAHKYYAHIGYHNFFIYAKSNGYFDLGISYDNQEGLSGDWFDLEGTDVLNNILSALRLHNEQT